MHVRLGGWQWQLGSHFTLSLCSLSPPWEVLQGEARYWGQGQLSVPAPQLLTPGCPVFQDLYVAEALSTLESWRSRYNQVVKDKGDLELEIIVLNEYVFASVFFFFFFFFFFSFSALVLREG
jgi:hypothetical protein